MTFMEEIVEAIHHKNNYDYDECQHGTYSGGPSHGEPYAMCERMAKFLVEAGYVVEPEYEYGQLSGGRVLPIVFEENHKYATHRRVAAKDWEEIQ